ncbi:hypothetical protein V8B55DRAFT_1457102 [Mucor lusitanicus]|uniref:Asteroid domain-containing protein n=2 Tax=Mucor circinelloides f. lusitanicus TaxID=29924 RepID=A0A168K8V5_MUCCL|nr:hypothetical protein FB192DRAFT_1350697 [Mucor lusitanicus]OAD02121.1 hypothetical protein MUCCIDRAFT_164060 [Mucor lusitanicus CBS 277.49]
MGIHGLSYFIKSLPSIIDQVKWKIELSAAKKDRDHFIIDGNAFVYHIAFEHRTNWTHGGQYAHIADTVTKTVDSLHRAGIRLTFLFDGALPQDKLETRVKRHKSYIERCASTYWNLKQINASNKHADEERQNGIQYYGDLFLIPPLTLEVIVQTLKELHVEIQACEAEADGEVVQRAARERAYVVSQDSDMHVYPDVGKGYIPLDSLSIPTHDTDSDYYISASVYHPEALARSLNLEPYQLPLFGTLLGNDYLDADLVRFPIGHWCSIEGIHVAKNNQSGWPKMVAEFIRRNTHIQEGKGKDCIIQDIADQLRPIIAKSSMKSREEKASGFEDRMINSICRYDTSSPLLKNSPDQECGTLRSSTLIDTISSQFSHTKTLSRQIMDVITSNTFWTSIFIEDIDRESSWDVSRSLRQGVYGSVHEKLLGNQKQQEIAVQEHVREKQHLEVVQVTGGVIEHQRSTALDDFYRFHVSNESHIQDHNPILHPLILCMRYMIYHCSQSIENGRLFNYEVVAMVISTLRSLAPTLCYSTKDEVPPHPDIGIPALKKRSIHLASQFQGVIYSSFLLSQVLDVANYLQSPQVLAHMYHGLYFHYYIEIARGGVSISRMLQHVAPAFKALFCSVYKAIMTGLYDQVLDVFDYDIITSAVEEWTISDNKPKRLISLNSSNQPEKKKKKKSPAKASNKAATPQNRNVNAFNVLSFGCNFDE